MSIRLILFFSLVSNYCQVMQLKRNENQLLFFVIDDMITQEKYRNHFFFLGGGGGGINCQSFQTSCQPQNKVQDYTLA